MARPRTLAQLLNDIANNPGVYFPALGTGNAGRTAQAATYLNYSPQFDTLRALLGQSNETLRTGAQSARRSGYAGSQGIQHIRDTYTQGLAGTLGNLGGPVDPNAATRNPDARAAQELGLSGQAVSGMLSQMAAQQVAGIGNQVGQLRRQHTSDLSSIAGKTGSLLGQAGAYNTQQYEGLAAANRKERAAAAQAAADRRTRLVTAGINPQTGQYDPNLNPPPKKPAPKAPHAPVDGVDYATWLKMTPEERRKAHKEWAASGRANKNTKDKKPALLPGGIKPLTQTAHNDFRNRVLRAKHWADILLKDSKGNVTQFGGDRHALATILLTGGKSGNTTIPSFDQDVVTAALDLAYRQGRLSHPTAVKLHKLGYSIKGLGFKTGANPGVAKVFGNLGF